MTQLFIIVGTVTDPEVAQIFATKEDKNVKVGDHEYRVTDDPVNPGWSHDYGSLASALEAHPAAQVVGVAGEVVTPLYRFVTYTTYEDENPVALTPEEWREAGDLDLDEWAWHLAPNKEAAIEKHYEAFDEYVGHGQDYYVHCDDPYAKIYEAHKALLRVNRESA